MAEEQQATIYVDNSDVVMCLSAPCPQRFETWFDGNALYGSLDVTSGGYRGTTIDARGVAPNGIVPALPFGARWRLPDNVPAGDYRVEVNIPDVSYRGAALVSAARYSIHHAGVVDSADISQRTERGWVDIGTYFFEPLSDAADARVVVSNFVEIDVQASFNTDINSTLIDAVRFVPAAAGGGSIVVRNYVEGYNDGAEIPVGTSYRTCFTVSAPTYFRWWWHDENVGSWRETHNGHLGDDSNVYCASYRTAANPGLRRMRIDAVTSLDAGGTVRASHEFRFRIVDAASPPCTDALNLKIPPPYPTTVTVGEAFDMAFEIENAGSCAWTVDEDYALLAEANGMGADRVPVPSRVDAGAAVWFRFRMQAPATPGEVRARWRLAHDGTPFGAPIEATIRVAPRAPTGGINGRVVDAHGRPLAGLDVVLLDRDQRMLQRVGGGADEDGRFRFAELAPGTYHIRANLQSSDNRMRFCWGTDTFRRGDPALEAACTIALTSKPVVVGDGVQSVTLRLIAADGTVTGPAMAAGVFDHLAPVYFTIRDFDDFARTTLGATYDPVAFVFAGWTAKDGRRYVEAGEAIALGVDVVMGSGSYGQHGRREAEVSIAHEASHHLMHKTISTPPRTGNNHAGYCNSTSADSLIEGWAAFFGGAYYSHVVAKGGAYYPDMLHGLDENVDARAEIWVPGFCLANVVGKPFHQLEDMAVATLLWDLYDTPGDAGRDRIDLSLPALYAAMTGAGRIDNVHHLYSILQAMESNNVRNENGSPVTVADVRSAFILHGFFEDANGNYRHDAGEAPGYSGDPDRRLRRFAPRSPRHHVRVLLAGSAQPVQDVRIRVIADHDELGTQEFEVSPDEDGLIYVPRPGEPDLARLTLSAQFANGWSPPYDLSGTAYAAAIDDAPLDAGYALTLTFYPNRPPARTWRTYLPILSHGAWLRAAGPAQPIDVVFAVDTSAAMRTPFGANPSKLGATVGALREAIDDLQADGIGDRAAIVGYTLQPSVLQGLTFGKGELADAAARLLAEPATASQIEPALFEAIRLLDGARPEAMSAVVLVSTASPGLEVAESDVLAADTLKRFGARLLVVALGAPRDSAWQRLASSPDDALLVNAPDDLAAALRRAVAAARQPR